MRIDISINGGATLTLTGSDANEMFATLTGYAPEKELLDPDTSIILGDSVNVTKDRDGMTVKM